MRIFISTGLVVAVLGWGVSMVATAQPLQQPSVQAIQAALSGPATGSAGLTRSFTRTQPPTQDGLCGGAAAPAARSHGRNLEIVSYVPQAAHVDLAVPFANDSDALTLQSRKVLKNLALALKSQDLSGKRFVIAGHTNDSGERAHNLELSCARSMAVRKFLIHSGVAADRISAYGFGPDQPAVAKDPGSEDNRRVEIRVGE